MPTSLFRSFLATLYFTIIAGCLGYIPAHAQQEESANSDVFKIGAIIPLTGPLADYGESVRKAFEHAKRRAPTKFQNIEFVYSDSAYDGKTSVNALQALINRGDINLYYIWGVTPNETLLPVTEARHLPVLAETSFKSAVVNKPFAIRAAPTGDMSAKVLIDGLHNRGVKKIGIISVDIPYYVDIIEAMRRHAEPKKIAIEVLDTVASDTSDFKSYIVKAKAKSYDAFGVFLLNQQISTWHKQAFDMKYQSVFFGAGIHDSHKLLSSIGPGAEGILFVGYDVDSSFQEEWLKEYGDDSRIGCIANAVDSAGLISELFGDGKSSKLPPRSIISRFSSLHPRVGVSGLFSFTNTPETGNSIEFPLGLRLFSNGRIERSK